MMEAAYGAGRAEAGQERGKVLTVATTVGDELNRHQVVMSGILERLDRLENERNPLEAFEEGGEVPRLEALVVSLQREERALSERNKYLEGRVQFLENHIRQVNRLTARIAGSEQAMEENTLAAVEESRGFAQRAAP